MILLGFDFGLRRIGVAAGQSITATATPLPVINAKDGVPQWNEIQKLLNEWQPDALVVGIPYNMDGSDQAITKAAQRFVNKLHSRYHIPVHKIDERLTTKAARAEIFAHGGYKALQKTSIDGVAAKLILESWMCEAKA